MADKERAQETARETTDTGRETVAKGAEIAQRASETASRGYEDLLILSRDNMEGMARASQAMLKGSADLGSVWASFWNEQLTTSVEATRSLAECRSWDEALTVQNEFIRTSLDRVYSRAVKSAEVTAETFTSSFIPLQEGARKAAERTPWPAA
jgi:hypothetical protein